MIYGAESHNGSSLREIADAACIDVHNYDWLISGHDMGCDEKEFFIDQNAEYLWLSGDRFAQLINAKSLYAIWCVASAFPKGTRREDVLKYDLPYADMNREFWKDDLTLQTPLTELELVIFDGYIELVISKEQKHRDCFIANSNGAFDLEKSNRLANSRVRTIEKVMGSRTFNSGNMEQKWYIYHCIFSKKSPSDEARPIVDECRNALEKASLLYC